LADGDGDWIGDACEAYIYGDADGDHAISIADAVYIVNYVSKGSPAPEPAESGDATCDSACDIADAVHLINYIFRGGLLPCWP